MSQKNGEQRAVHFGAGNIGRGFLGPIYQNSGYQVIFADVVKDLINSLQSTPSYTVTEVGTEGEKSLTIDNYRAINSKDDEQAVINELKTANIVTCAVGPNILKFIAPLIAKGIDARESGTKPIAVVACENAIGATDQLASFIKDEKNTPADRLATIHDRARFANSAIDRIVPGQDPGSGLNVKIESYFEWVIDETPFKGVSHPDLHGVKWVDDLKPYIERKLYTVNTGHAAAAYHGHHRGKKMVHEAMEDKEIHDIVQATLRETSQLLIATHGLNKDEQAMYAQKIVTRISNPHLKDIVERVGRAPLRKLSRKERFVGPASGLAERGEKVEALLSCVEVALRFQDVEGDAESVELAKTLKEHGAKDATAKITGLEPDHPLFTKIVAVVEKVQGEKK